MFVPPPPLVLLLPPSQSSRGPRGTKDDGVRPLAEETEEDHAPPEPDTAGEYDGELQLLPVVIVEAGGGELPGCLVSSP